MRWFPVVAVVAACGLSGCAASPPPAPAPTKSSAPMSLTDTLAWHWAGAFCSTPREVLTEIGNLGAHAADDQTAGTSTPAHRKQFQQEAVQDTTTLAGLVHDNAVQVAETPPSATRDRINAVYQRLEADLGQLRRRADQLPTSDAATFGDAVVAITDDVHAAMERARKLVAADAVVGHYLRGYSPCS
ncbi:hypothetical protein [Amycolatopsis sp. DSM 110486]|uniref:hypothetical protein n=1 Tax=Amycolatopsis sp. DSM 110486 TaxID=2865832 RepID=UPI001C6A505E|nr:hypothetical protein [Amycolatopsis sp. DSM 110486]QYN24942.1 hypothetical protein K1T34_22415 [Amycolatopsis sp. DSM 110486]